MQGKLLERAGRWTAEGKRASIVLFLFIIWIPFALLWTGRNIVLKLLPSYHTYYGKTESERIRLVSPSIFPAIEMVEKKTSEDARILIVLPRGERDPKLLDFGVRDYRWTYFRLKYYLSPRSIYLYDGDDKNIQDVIAFCKKRDIGYYMVYGEGKTAKLERVK
jgi:hypothetical protein